MLALSMASTSEILHLGKSLGISPELLSSIMKSSSGNNWCIEKYNPVPGVMPTSPASKNYVPGFGVQLMLKDVKLAVDAAREKNVHLTMGETVRKLYTEVVDNPELKDKDFSVIYKHVSSH